MFFRLFVALSFVAYHPNFQDSRFSGLSQYSISGTPPPAFGHHSSWKFSAVGRTIIQHPTVAFALIVSNQGEVQSEHTTPFDVSVHIVNGVAQIPFRKSPQLKDRRQERHAPSKRHAPQASDGLKMLLLIINGKRRQNGKRAVLQRKSPPLPLPEQLVTHKTIPALGPMPPSQDAATVKNTTFRPMEPNDSNELPKTSPGQNDPNSEPRTISVTRATTGDRTATTKMSA